MNQDKTLPCGWSFALLKQVLKKLVDGSHNPPPKQEYGFPMLSARNIENGQINFNDYRFIEQKAFETENKRTQVHPGDVLLTIVGAIGRTATVPDNIDLFTLQRSVAVLSPVGMIPDFLMYQLQSPQVQKELLKEAKGTAQKGIYLKTLGGIPVLLPPLNEQRRIVAKIEALKARSQRVKEALEDIPQLLDQFRQSVLAAAFRGDLTADWREQNPDVETASVLLERIRAERRRRWEEAELEKMKASGKLPKDDKWKEKYKDTKTVDTDNLPEIPDGWIWVTADDLCYQITDGEHNQPPYQEEGFPMLTAKHVQDGFVDMADAKFISKEDFEKSLLRCAPENGDLLIVSVGATTGRAAIVFDCPPFALVRSVLLLKPLSNVRFIQNWIRSRWCQSWIGRASGATAQAHLYINDTKRMPVPLPPGKEQQEIIKRVESLFKVAQNIQNEYQEIKANLNQLDQSTLAKAFRGELVPQDPDDEPASVLLEHIRAERAKLQTKAAKKSTPPTGGRRSKKTSQQEAEPVQLELGLE